MGTTAFWREQLEAGTLDARLGKLYLSRVSGQRERYLAALSSFEALYGADGDVHLFSAPGRSEIGGNHTDHNHGRVLAAAVNLDVIAVVSPSDQMEIRLKSEGHQENVVNLGSLERREDETGHSNALIRGICARFAALGYKIGGFRAYTTSQVFSGSGLSSSAAFEVLVCAVLNHLYNDGALEAPLCAQISQWAENNYFGKPCGLMDQTACACGGLTTIDFADPREPVIESVDFDLARSGYSLCIVNTGGNHADLTGDYASVPEEMRGVARLLGVEVLRKADPEDFFAKLPQLRGKVNDRALLRAIHFFSENQRVSDQVAALRRGDMDGFLSLVEGSGLSSFMCNQNIYPSSDPSEQGLTLALALSRRILGGEGVCRVHGGGFAGTIQAFVPQELTGRYTKEMDRVFGPGSCLSLDVRAEGSVIV